jgi:hypothetical protein
MIELMVMFGGALVGIAVGIIYFAKSHKSSALLQRALASAYGPAVACLFLAAALWPDRHRYSQASVQVFYWLQLVPLALLVYSLAAYPGPRRIHWWLVPVGFLAWVWSFSLGFLFVHGE